MEKVSVTKENIQKISDAVADLLAVHAAEIHSAIEDSDDKKASVTFKVTIEHQLTIPAIEVFFSFTPCKITDNRELQCDDPLQEHLPLTPGDSSGVLRFGNGTVRTETEDQAAAREEAEVSAQVKRNNKGRADTMKAAAARLAKL